jgi:hypothetical protein
VTMPVVPAARSQSGVVSRAQALAVGLTRRQVDHLVRSGRWRRVLPGVYVVPHRTARPAGPGVGGRPALRGGLLRRRPDRPVALGRRRRPARDRDRLHPGGATRGPGPRHQDRPAPGPRPAAPPRRRASPGAGRGGGPRRGGRCGPPGGGDRRRPACRPAPAHDGVAAAVRPGRKGSAPVAATARARPRRGRRGCAVGARAALPAGRRAGARAAARSVQPAGDRLRAASRDAPVPRRAPRGLAARVAEEVAASLRVRGWGGTPARCGPGCALDSDDVESRHTPG